MNGSEINRLVDTGFHRKSTKRHMKKTAMLCVAEINGAAERLEGMNMAVPTSGLTIKGMIGSLLTSKKFAGLVVGLCVTGLAYAGMEGPEAEAFAESAMGMVAAYCVGQGIADHGKERAKIEANGATA